ncbi:unnamed protein product [Moneuplotes crassus]|uniref:Uncharacterized protein n=1 Tax=Euplotes crassus TaxID=5936 RepID=A0AAD1XTR6_EUPCR|nr:unnamed protein product [Moneuplotes crassus]
MVEEFVHNWDIELNQRKLLETLHTVYLGEDMKNIDLNGIYFRAPNGPQAKLAQKFGKIKFYRLKRFDYIDHDSKKHAKYICSILKHSLGSCELNLFHFNLGFEERSKFHPYKNAVARVVSQTTQRFWLISLKLSSKQFRDTLVFSRLIQIKLCFRICEISLTKDPINFKNSLQGSKFKELELYGTKAYTQDPTSPSPHHNKKALYALIRCIQKSRCSPHLPTTSLSISNADI